MLKKLYLLDTNVLVHNPKSLFDFEHAIVAIPAISLEQLDEFKKEGTSRGKNSRDVIRTLDQLRSKGSLQEGIPLENGSLLKIVFLPSNASPLPFHVPVEDNEILRTAMALKEDRFDVTFVSKDLNARVKADALGLATQDYANHYVSRDELYRGWRVIQVPSVQLKREYPQDFEQLVEEGQLEINEFVIVESNNNPHNCRVFRYLGGKQFLAVGQPSFRWPLQPRNIQQVMALNLLLDNSIQMVTLLGPAGTGKTFLALLAGLHKVLVEDIYQKMLVSRPIMPLGRDIGYLPGTLQEKLHAWMMPVYDNMEFIVHAALMGQHMQAVQGSGEHEQEPHHDRHEKHDKYGKHRKHKHSKKQRGYEQWNRNGGGAASNGNLQPLDELVRRGKISLEAITYMRGRSIPYQYILIDEAQNLTPHEMKTIVSRVGEGSKIVFAGDPFQIDSPYLDFSSNGLVVTAEKFKGQQIFGSVYLEMSERSLLSQLAGELL